MVSTISLWRWSSYHPHIILSGTTVLLNHSVAYQSLGFIGAAKLFHPVGSPIWPCPQLSSIFWFANMLIQIRTHQCMSYYFRVAPMVASDVLLKAPSMFMEVFIAFSRDTAVLSAVVVDRPYSRHKVGETLPACAPMVANVQSPHWGKDPELYLVMAWWWISSLLSSGFSSFAPFWRSERRGRSQRSEYRDLNDQMFH